MISEYYLLMTTK